MTMRTVPWRRRIRGEDWATVLVALLIVAMVVIQAFKWEARPKPADARIIAEMIAGSAR